MPRTERCRPGRYTAPDSEHRMRSTGRRYRSTRSEGGDRSMVPRSTTAITGAAVHRCAHPRSTGRSALQIHRPARGDDRGVDTGSAAATVQRQACAAQRGPSTGQRDTGRAPIGPGLAGRGSTATEGAQPFTRHPWPERGPSTGAHGSKRFVACRGLRRSHPMDEGTHVLSLADRRHASRRACLDADRVTGAP